MNRTDQSHTKQAMTLSGQHMREHWEELILEN